MAQQLAQYYQQTSVGGPGLPSAPGAVQASNAEAVGLERLGQGLEAFGSGLAHEEHAAQQLVKRQANEDGKAWAGNAVPDLAVKFDTFFEESKAAATGPATGFVPQFLSKFDDTAKATIAMAPTPEAKKYLEAHLNGLRAAYGQHAVKFEADSTRAWRVDQSDQGADKWAMLVAKDPSQASTALAAVEQTLPDVGPAMREKLLDASRRKILGAAAGTAVQRDPHATFAAINQALNIPTPPTPNPFKVADKVATLPSHVQQVIAAVYGQESNSGAADTSQPNYGGARGPMQVTEPTFNGLKANGLIPADFRWDNPDHTSHAGMVLLKDLYGKYQGDVRKVAAAYYAGEKAVNADGTINDFKDLKNPKAPTTLQYADSIVARMGMGGGQPPPLKTLEPVDASRVPAMNVSDLRAKEGSFDRSEWGRREDGSKKGDGFLGVLQRPDGGVSTEITVGVEIEGKEIDVPSLVPTLSRSEVKTLLSLKDGEPVPDAIIDKAEAFARQRVKEGKSVFAEPGEVIGPKATGIGWVDAMKPDELLHYRSQAYTEMQRTTSVAKHGLERMEKDIQAQAMAGIVPTNIPSRDSYVAAFGPVDGVIRHKEMVTDMVDLGRGISLLQSAGPEDRAAMIRASTPTQGDGFAAASAKQAQLAHANAIIEKQLKDDPATYVSRNSPRVKAAFTELQALGPTATPDQQRAAVDRYAAESLAEQTRLGAKRPQLLTDDQASKIALQFSSQKEGGDSSAKLIEGLQKQWGSNFPVIFQQLQRDDKLPGDVMVIPNMKDAGAKERLARLALVPDKDLKERLAPGDAKDLDAALLSTMEPFWNTLAVQGGGERTYATVKRSTERLAMSYMAGGKSAGDAVKQAYEETVGHGYSFEKTYRVPKAEMPEQVTEGARGIGRHLEDLPLIVPPAAAGIRPEDAKKQYLDAVKAGAVFATNPDETGLLLYVKGATGMVPVKTPFGQVSFTWKQLRDEYQSMQGKPFVGYAKP